MAFDISKNKRNKELEEQGTWMDYGDGVRFLVARRSNQKYKNFISRQFRKHERLLGAKNPTKYADGLSDKITLEGVATYLLLDWEGVVREGQPLPYSPEVAMQVLEDHDDLRADIEDFADDRDNYVQEAEAEDLDNVKE